MDSINRTAPASYYHFHIEFERGANTGSRKPFYVLVGKRDHSRKTRLLDSWQFNYDNCDFGVDLTLDGSFDANTQKIKSLGRFAIDREALVVDLVSAARLLHGFNDGVYSDCILDVESTEDAE